MPFFAMVNSTSVQIRVLMFITMIKQGDHVWMALLNRLNSHWSSFFVPSVKAPEINTHPKWSMCSSSTGNLLCTSQSTKSLKGKTSEDAFTT